MIHNRILTEADGKRLQELFIGDDEVKVIKQFISENLASKKDWRAFGHYQIYNSLNNFRNGILKKLQLVRNDISCSTAEEVIELLYIMGYGLKRIIFLTWEMGFLNQTAWTIKRHIKREKFYLNIERQKFVELMAETKKTVFQSCAAEVSLAEERTVKIYIKQLNDLNNELEHIDIQEEHGKARRIRKDIKEITETLLKCHGVDNAREWAVRVAGEKELLREKVRLMPSNNSSNLPANKPEGDVIEAEATFLTEAADSLKLA